MQKRKTARQIAAAKRTLSRLKELLPILVVEKVVMQKLGIITEPEAVDERTLVVRFTVLADMVFHRLSI